MLIDPETRLRAARGLGKTETAASIEVFRTMQRRGHPVSPPPLISDGWGGIREAMVEVYGTVPNYSGRGRPPTNKQPQPGWHYVQAVKQRKQGRVVGTRRRVIYGTDSAVLKQLGAHTAYVERTHLTSRQFNSRLHRKTLGYSKAVELHRAAVVWGDSIYNFVRPLKSLRQKDDAKLPRTWAPRTPAMAARLTDHIWTVNELLTTVVCPGLSNT